MPAAVFATEPGPGRTDEAVAGGIAIVVSAIVVTAIVAVIVGIGIVIGAGAVPVTGAVAAIVAGAADHRASHPASRDSRSKPAAAKTASMMSALCEHRRRCCECNCQTGSSYRSKLCHDCL